MEILWECEEGRCAWCGRKSAEVRGHSDSRRYLLSCYACWDAQQDGCILSVQEWREEASYVFVEPPGGDRKDVGAAQGALLN